MGDRQPVRADPRLRPKQIANDVWRACDPAPNFGGRRFFEAETIADGLSCDGEQPIGRRRPRRTRCLRSPTAERQRGSSPTAASGAWSPSEALLEVLVACEQPAAALGAGVGEGPIGALGLSLEDLERGLRLVD
jgi:hypothetical protein